MAENPEPNSSNGLIRLTHFWQKQKNQPIEDILVNYYDLFARHSIDIGMNTKFKMKLTPKDDNFLYSQCLPTPIHLKEDKIVELALMYKHGIITVLPSSEYASPIFAQRKTNEKLRLLVGGSQKYQHTDCR